MTMRYFGPTNGFLPRESGIVTSQVRDVKKFKIGKYTTNIQSPSPVAAYRRMDTNSPARVTSDAIHRWADGARSPRTNHLGTHDWDTCQTQRRAYDFEMGNQTISAANKLGGFDIVGYESKAAAQRAITNRTNRVITMLDTASNWAAVGGQPGDHTADADDLNEGRGFWDQASSNENDSTAFAIFFTLMAAFEQIKLDTNGNVTMDDLLLILSPRAAYLTAGSGEMRAYMKGSVDAMKIVKGEHTNADRWGLPDRFHGMEVVVEDCVMVSDVASAGHANASSRAFVKSDDVALLVARPGSMDSPYGSQNWSTVNCFWYTEREGDGSELEVEVKTDDWHRLTEGRVVEQFAEKLVAPITGFHISNILSE